MGRVGILAVVVAVALGALVVLATQGGPRARPGVPLVDTGSRARSVLAPAEPPSPPATARVDGDRPPLPVRVPVPEPHTVDAAPSRGDGGHVVKGELHEDRFDTALGDWTLEPRRSTGRVRYMPVGPLDGRTLIEQDLVDVQEFTSAPLAAGEWIIETRIPGFQPDVEWGDTINGDHDCFVSLREGAEIELDVRLPDGTQPPLALFAFVGRDPGEVRAFGPRSEEVSWHATSLWTPSEPRVCVFVDDPELATDLIFVAEPTGESPYDAREPSRYVSSPIAVDATKDAPIRVQLREACAMHVTVTGPESPALQLWRWGRAVRLDACDGFDIEALLARSVHFADWPPELLDRQGFDWLATNSAWYDEKTLRAPYLLPGRWLVAAGWNGEDASTTQIVEVVPGLTEVVLALGQPATSNRIRARFVVGGEPVAEPAAELSFALVPAGRERARRAVGVHSVSGTGGRWFAREELGSAQHAIRDELGSEVPVHLVAWPSKSTLVRTAFVSAPLGALAGDIVLQQLTHAELTLHVAHTSERIVSLGVAAHLVDPTPTTRLVQFAVPEPLDPVNIRFVLPPSGHIGQVPGKLLPGRWRFEVHLSNAPMVQLEPIEVDLRSGSQPLAVTLPALFDVTVHAPRSQTGTVLRVQKFEAPPTAGGATAQLEEHLGTGQRVVFEDLPAGRYVLSDSAGSAPIHIVVPCGEVGY